MSNTYGCMIRDKFDVGTHFVRGCVFETLTSCMASRIVHFAANFELQLTNASYALEIHFIKIWISKIRKYISKLSLTPVSWLFGDGAIPAIPLPAVRIWLPGPHLIPPYPLRQALKMLPHWHWRKRGAQHASHISHPPEGQGSGEAAAS